MGLKEYRGKRLFGQTPEPAGEERPQDDGRRFVVQEHHASRLHYDLRLEADGVLKSWAVPKGPTLDPSSRRLAVQTEDHPLEYGSFEGEIPEGNYGAGQVLIWDQGTYEPVEPDAGKAIEDGSIGFRLHGEKLKGEYRLVCTGCRDGEPSRWLLIKKHDDAAVEGYKTEPIQPGPTHRHKATSGRKGGFRLAPATNQVDVPPAPPLARKPARPTTDTVSLAELIRQGDLASDVTVAVGGQDVRLTHLERVYWPQEGITKGDVLRYYAHAGETIMPYLRGRPCILQRYPRGIGAQGFFQHDLPDAPEWLTRVPLENEDGRIVHYAVYTGLASLLYLANLGTIEQHPWHSRIDDLDHPDYLVLDLDPHQAPFERVLQVALAAREVLEGVGLKGYAKTSGSRGAHVYVPVGRRLNYDEAADVAKKIAGCVVERRPDIATGERMLSAREKGKVYVDWVQNHRGKTAAAPYSLRTRPGATVSTPLTWDEVERGVDPADFTLATVPDRLRRAGDPWEGMLLGSGNPRKALARLGP